MITYSEIESEVFGLKTGRFETEGFDGKALREEILAEKYDLIRIKAPAYFDEINLNLFDTGFPFYFAGGIRKFNFRDPVQPGSELLNKDLTVELYNGSQTEALRHVITSSYMFYPLGYYKTPGLPNYISKEKEVEALYRYFAKYYVNSQYPDNFVWFMKRGNDYVGLCALHFRGTTMECPLGAVIPDAQNGGVFYDILRYSRSFAWNKGIKYIEAGVRSENLVSQHVFTKQARVEGVEILGDIVDFVFHLVPMAGKGIK